MPTFKLFVASPGDVMVERRRVENVVSRLNGEFAGVARLEAIRWETEFYQAYSTFQAQIPPSTECDLVIGILKWPALSQRHRLRAAHRHREAPEGRQASGHFCLPLRRLLALRGGRRP
jgi:hypothetical protein